MKTERSFKDRRRRKKGVSPVIGVILMVAATIVIAAVVLAMLGGFQAPTRQYVVMATASENSTGSIGITYHGGPDSSFVSSTYYSLDGGTVASLGSSVGSTTTVAGTAGPDNNHVVVNVSFIDGSSQVILDTWV